jgi:GNAT superfamily N-acetyltransferase
MTHVTLRRLQPTDSEALRELFAFSPDGGQFAISPQYQIDPCQALIDLSPNTTGVVAEESGSGKIVGVGLVQIEERYLDGMMVPCALLYSLTVHPSYRRQGIATRLGQWRIAHARQEAGEGVAILAFIQKGNIGSLTAAQKWGRQTSGQYRNSLLRTRQKPPREAAGLIIREANTDEHDQIARNLNVFYGDYNLYAPQTGRDLTKWLQETPFTRPFRHYYVAVDSQDTLLAGLAVAEQSRIVTMRVQNMPAPARLLNRIVNMVPPDGTLRQLGINKIWYAPEHLSAAQYLWESMRWRLRDRGSHLLCSHDPRGPISKVISLPFWMPKGTSGIVAQNLTLDGRLICQP